MIIAPVDPDDQVYFLPESTVRLCTIYSEYGRIDRDQGIGTIRCGFIRMISGDETYPRTNKKPRGLLSWLMDKRRRQESRLVRTVRKRYG
jgi:hypothetical protein